MDSQIASLYVRFNNYFALKFNFLMGITIKETKLLHPTSFLFTKQRQTSCFHSVLYSFHLLLSFHFPSLVQFTFIHFSTMIAEL